jgi:transposase
MAEKKDKTGPKKDRPPLPNYTLATVCPACNTPTYRLACKVRCPRCGFMWDCSEL